MAGSWYNGYSPQERDAKFKALKRLIASGTLRAAQGPCGLCGDPDVPVEYHSEDYSQPYLWEPPALLALCRCCHRHKLHQRFSRPTAWAIYIAHVRRGGYARDLDNPAVKKELAAHKAALQRGQQMVLKPLRPYGAGGEWFANLRMDPESLTDPKARPRP